MVWTIKKMMEDKKEYKAQMKKVTELPEDYQFVFEKIQHYMWQFASGDGMDVLQLQYELISMFEEGALSNKHVLELTGDDVAAFCDELLKDTKKWSDKYSTKLNMDIEKKLKDE